MISTAVSALRGTAQSSTAANTAPVHEFRCLYTHDIRRKQKRWQDGFLKFHTFNKRVMVYDQPRNYIGDTHWKDRDTLDDGDELTLENGVIVQVSEPLAITQTDLTPLFEKRPKDSSERPAAGNVRLPPVQGRLPTPGVRNIGLAASVIPRHKPLSQLLGTPKGPHGRAMLPTRSPFEERQANLQKEDEWAASERAAKRRRVAEAEQIWSNAKETRTPMPRGRGNRTFGREDMTRTPPVAQESSRRVGGELIDLVSDAEEAEPQSDVTLPNTPPGFVRAPVRVKKKRAALPPKTPHPPQPPSSPPVSTTNRVIHVQEETELLEQAIGDQDNARGEEEAPKRSKKLRLATGSRPKMLLCQDVPPSKNAEKIARAWPPERQDGEAVARVPQKSRAAIPSEPQGHVPESKQTSQIRKLQNGLTHSSPPEQSDLSGGFLPPADDDGAVFHHRELASASKRHTTSLLGVIVSEDHRAQSRGGDVPVQKPIITTSKPNIQVQPVAPPDRPHSPRAFRRIRSENYNPPRREAAVHRSFDESELIGKDEPRSPIRVKDSKKLLQRSTSLVVSAPYQPGREKSPPSPVVDTDIGPWSTEAMDLFDWKPPDYVYRGQGKGFGPAGADAANDGATAT